MKLRQILLPWNTSHKTDLLHPRRNQLVKMKGNFIIAAVLSCLAVLGVGTVLGTQAAKTGDRSVTRKVPVSDYISMCRGKYLLLLLLLLFSASRTYYRGHNSNGTPHHITSITVSKEIIRSIHTIVMTCRENFRCSTMFALVQGLAIG